jgi:hypothetical protein
LLNRLHTWQPKRGLNNEYSECHSHNNDKKEEDILEFWVEEKELLLRVHRLQKCDQSTQNLLLSTIFWFHEKVIRKKNKDCFKMFFQGWVEKGENF